MQVNCHICNKSFLKKTRKEAKKHFCSRECLIKKEQFCIICKNPTHKNHKDFCLPCYEKDYYERNPEKKRAKLDKCIKRSMNEARKRRGLPLDHPPLKGEVGRGYIIHGYRVVIKHGHPNCRKDKGAIFEHVWIMSQYLGRPLFKGEQVHHINGIRDDNRIENLELWSKSQPPGQRVSDKIKFYSEFLEKYGAKVDLSSVANIVYDDESCVTSSKTYGSDSDK